MTIATLGFLKKLLDTAGPSGFEQAPARVWRAEVEGFADEVRADVHGNSVAALNPKGKPRLMLAGHIDEIGLQITHIDDEGFLYFSGIGGWDSQVLVGQRVLLLGRAGPVRGVIGSSEPVVSLSGMTTRSTVPSPWASGKQTALATLSIDLAHFS